MMTSILNPALFALVMFALAACDKEATNDCAAETWSDARVCVDGELVCPTGPGESFYQFQGVCREASASEYFTTEVPIPCHPLIVLPETAFTHTGTTDVNGFYNADHIAFSEQGAPVKHYRVDGRDSLWRPYLFDQSTCSDASADQKFGYAFGATRLSERQARVTIYTFDAKRFTERPYEGRYGLVDSIVVVLEKP